MKKNTSIVTDFKKIYTDKGIFILYRGLESAIWRQLFYASARLGSYTWAVEKLKNKGKKITLFDKITISAFSGIFGALIGNPFDVALIRRQVSVSTGKNAYKNTFQAFNSIVK